MYRKLIYSALFSALLSTSSFAAVPSERDSLDALQASRYSWMTDGLDMQGGGTTWVEMLADQVIDRIEQRWNMQGQVRSAFQTALKDPFFRSAADELIRQTPETFVTTFHLTNTHMENPVVANAFQNYGILSGVMELALSVEQEKLGYLQQIYGGPIDARSAVLKLWRAASSPAEERLRYAAAYRYGVD